MGREGDPVRTMPKSTHSLFGYALAVASVLAILVLGQLLWTQLQWSTGALFFCAVLLCAYWGVGPALLATALSMLAIDVYFMVPYGGLSYRTEDLVWLVGFMIPSVAIAWLFHSFRRARVRLTQQSELFRVALSSIGDAVLTTDTEGRVTFMNAVAQDLTGWRIEECLYRPVGEVLRLVNEATGEPVESPAERVLDSGAAANLAHHTCLIGRDGTSRPVEDSAAPILDDAGRSRGVILVFRDVTRQREAQRAVRESEERLRFALNAASMGTWEWDLDTNRLTWSENLETIHGFDPGGFDGSFETFRTLIHPDDRPAVDAAIARALEEGQFYDEEFRIIPTEGEVRWMAGKGRVIRDATGRPRRMIGVGLDVTKRKRAEEAHRESEDRFRRMADEAPALIWLSDTKGRGTWFNQQWREFTGRTLEQECGDGWHEGIHPDDRDRCLRIWSASFEARTPFRLEHRLRRHDGTYRWILCSATPSFTPDGTFVGYIACCVDIHDRIEAENALKHLNETLEERVNERARAAEERAVELAQSQQALEESETLYRTIGETIPYGIWMCDAEGNLEYLSQSFLDLLGKTLEECKNFGWMERLEAEEVQPTIEAWKALVAHGEDWNWEHNVYGVDGRRYTILSRGRPIRDAEGNVQRWVGVHLDITARREADRALHKETASVRLLQAVAVAANEAATVESALQTCIERVCEHTGWPLGHAYNLGSDNFLSSAGVWCTQNGDRWSEFRSYTESLKLPAGSGFPGGVCATAEPIWLTHVAEDPGFRRRDAAREAGLRTAFAFPVLVGRSVGAVLEFFSPDLVEPDPPLLEVMAHVGTQIGRVIERKRAEANLARLLHQTEATEARFRMLLESAPDPVVITNGAGEIVLINSQAERVFGYEREELLGQPIEMLVPERYRDSHVPERQTYQGHPTTRPMGLGRELFGRHADGSEFPVEISLSPLETTEGPLVISIVRDITERKQLEAALRQSERLAAIGQMITGLSHESRNALQRSLAALEMLSRKIQDRPQALMLLNEAQKAQIDLQQVYEEVREYAAPVLLQRVYESVERLWWRSWDDLAMLRRDRDARLVDDVNGYDTRCEVDTFRIQQVFRNLMENALAARTDPVEIRISCFSGTIEGKEALGIVLRDNGPGLDKEQAEKIFEPFYTTKAKGTGLGMPIVKRTIESHGGRIYVDPGPGRGLEVTILLPRSSS